MLLKSFIELFVIASFYFLVAAFWRIDYAILTHNFGSHRFPMRPAGAFFSLRCLIYKVHAVFGGTLPLYEIHSRLSSTFFKFFEKLLFHLSFSALVTRQLG